MTSEDNLLMISGIQHFVFCRRQWALIHIEQQWAENLLTVSGEIMHKNAHDNFSSEKRGELIISRGMPVCSYELGINGVCDVVEFHRAKEGAIVHGYEGHYKIIPVEYKHGSPKEDESDILQVVAQAMCLEDMFCTAVEEVHIYYGKTRRRLKLDVNSDIRNRVKEIVAEMHTLYERRYTPRVKSHKGCKACSLREICLPKLCKVKSVREYIDSAIKEEKI